MKNIKVKKKEKKLNKDKEVRNYDILLSLIEQNEQKISHPHMIRTFLIFTAVPMVTSARPTTEVPPNSKLPIS